MSELPKEVRQKTDTLDAVGNTTAATGKGFAICFGCINSLCIVRALCWCNQYQRFQMDGINIIKADVLASLFVGGMIPIIFSSLAIQAVGKAAMSMVEEVRRQFKSIPGN
jgi:K(+)-stimulated pyrophosphate-energized sodium pump